MVRFEYVQFDDHSLAVQKKLMVLFENLSDEIDLAIEYQETKDLIFEKLIDTFMWVGVGIKTDQVVRNGGEV